MKRKICHLLLLPLLLCGMISGCLPGAKTVRAAEPDTGGIRILMTDVLGGPLPGARFRIAREASFPELQDSGVEKFLLQVGKNNMTMVWAEFWTERETEGERKNTLVTDESGGAGAYGLPCGTYYLVETAPPAGYSRMEDPMRIRISRYSHLTAEDQVYDDDGKLIDNTVHIVTLSRGTRQEERMSPIMLTAGISGIVFSGAMAILLSKLRLQGFFSME